MTFDEVLKYFWNQSHACDAINVHRANFSLWRKKGYIPFGYQKQFQEVTNGVLIADNPRDLAKRFPRKIYTCKKRIEKKKKFKEMKEVICSDLNII